MTIKKIAIAVGHTASGVAGCGAVGLLNESNETRNIAPILADNLTKVGYTTKIFRIDKANSYEYEDCYVRAAEANSWGADLYIEIHLNCSSNPKANGTEVLIYPGSSKSAPYAKKVNDSICKELGTFDRTYGTGYKESSLIVLRKTNMPAILIEPLFVGNANDVSKYTAEKVALAIAKGLDSNITTSTTNQSVIKNNEFNEEEYPMYLFSENWYLYRYNDVKQAVKKGTFKSGYEHYIKYGKAEKRQSVPPIPGDFNEGDYLELNQDVKQAVEKGDYISGAQHYMLNGFKETRKINKGERDEAAKKRIIELENKLEEIKKIID